jgi:hypothetical protein
VCPESAHPVKNGHQCKKPPCEEQARLLECTRRWVRRVANDGVCRCRVRRRDRRRRRGFGRPAGDSQARRVLFDRRDPGISAWRDLTGDWLQTWRTPWEYSKPRRKARVDRTSSLNSRPVPPRTTNPRTSCRSPRTNFQQCGINCGRLAKPVCAPWPKNWSDAQNQLKSSTPAFQSLQGRCRIATPHYKP